MPIRLRASSALQRTHDFSPNDALEDGGLGKPVEANADGTDGEKVSYTLRYVTTRDVLARQNMFSRVRYIQDTDDGARMVTERDFPMGDMRLATVRLVLVKWNLFPDSTTTIPYPITEETMLDLIPPDELEWLFNHAINMNPEWGGRGSGEAETR